MKATWEMSRQLRQSTWALMERISSQWRHQSYDALIQISTLYYCYYIMNERWCKWNLTLQLSIRKKENTLIKLETGIEFQLQVSLSGLFFDQTKLFWTNSLCDSELNSLHLPLSNSSRHRGVSVWHLCHCVKSHRLQGRAPEQLVGPINRALSEGCPLMYRGVQRSPGSVILIHADLIRYYGGCWAGPSVHIW